MIAMVLTGMVWASTLQTVPLGKDRLVFTARTSQEIQTLFDQHVRSGGYRYATIAGYPSRTRDPMNPRGYLEQSGFDLVLIRRAVGDATNGYYTWHGVNDEQLAQAQQGLDPARGYVLTQQSSWCVKNVRQHWVWFEATLPTPATNPPRLTDDDFKEAAKELKCEEACVRAVCEVEAGKEGFLESRKPKILFEAHVFSRLTKGMYDKDHPRVSVRTAAQARPLYQGGEKEYDRLLEAAKLDQRAALQSASWGRFQIMGFNHQAAGHDSVEAFVAAMYKSEREHLRAFVKFLEAKKLTEALREKRWEDFARGYNGAGYKANRYDEKLAAAYRKYKDGK